MARTFCFSKELQIILYGVSAASEHMYRTLRQEGYHVAAFFDRRYQELEGRYPIPVYAVSDNPYGESEKDGFCVVILLQNAMQHEGIAREFLKEGYRKILFSPMSGGLNGKTAAMFRDQYNLLLTGQFQELKRIPLLHEELFEQEVDTGHSIIRREGDSFVVWCPAELLYSGRAFPEHPAYAGIPLSAHMPYLELFQHLQGDRDGCTAYLEVWGVHRCKFPNAYTDADILAQRKRLLEIYKNELNKGMEFFISSAAIAEWDGERKVFNLIDGHHRSVFLLMQDFRYVPLRISKTDFAGWNAFGPGEAVQAHLDHNGKRLPILHPKYKKVNEASDRNALLQLEAIQRYIAADRDSWMEGRTVLDLSGTYGYYARNALRMRAERAVLYAPEGTEAARELHMLEGFPDIGTVDGWERAAGEEYHTLFVLNALADMAPDGKEMWVDRCARLCLEECFVTVGEPAELALWERRFTEARELRVLFDGKRTVRLYALRK